MGNKTWRRAGAIALATMLAVSMAPAAQADDGAPLTLSSDTAAVGESVTISGAGCVRISGPDAWVALAIDGDELVAVENVAEDGTWSATVVVEESFAPQAEITATCQQYTDSFSYAPATLTVTEAEEGAIVADSGSIDNIVRDGCKVTITVTTAGPVPFSLEVWDDGDIIDVFTWNETGTRDVVWTITNPAGEEVPGVGFVLNGSEDRMDSVDPWEYPAEAADECSAAVPVELKIVDYPGAFKPGDTVKFTGSGYLPGEEVLIFILLEKDLEGSDLPEESLVTVIADENGDISGTIDIAADAALGKYGLVAAGVESGRVGIAAFDVTKDGLPTVKPSKPGKKPGLPSTGN